jgi:hypothetical protein
MEGGLYRYPLTNILRTAKFLPTWGFNHLTPYCDLEVQKPIQALQSVKDPANTFD